MSTPRRVTRGEPRPVHITLIATCRVHNSRSSIVIPSRGVTPGLSPGPWRLGLLLVRRPYGDPIQRSSESVSRDLGRCLSCASAGPLRSTRAALLVGLLTQAVLSESVKSESALTGFFGGAIFIESSPERHTTRLIMHAEPASLAGSGKLLSCQLEDRRDHDDVAASRAGRPACPTPIPTARSCIPLACLRRTGPSLTSGGKPRRP